MSKSIAFRSVENYASCTEWEGGRLVRTETVHEDGRIECHVRGHLDGEDVDQRRTYWAYPETPRLPDGRLDLETIRTARLASKHGWSVVE